VPRTSDDFMLTNMWGGESEWKGLPWESLDRTPQAPKVTILCVSETTGLEKVQVPFRWAKCWYYTTITNTLRDYW